MLLGSNDDRSNMPQIRTAGLPARAENMVGPIEIPEPLPDVNSLLDFYAALRIPPIVFTDTTEDSHPEIGVRSAYIRCSSVRQTNLVIFMTSEDKIVGDFVVIAENGKFESSIGSNYAGVAVNMLSQSAINTSLNELFGDGFDIAIVEVNPESDLVTQVMQVANLHFSAEYSERQK